MILSRRQFVKQGLLWLASGPLIARAQDVVPTKRRSLSGPAGGSLLTSLSHYYKMDEATGVVPLVDAVGTANIQNITGTNDEASVSGIINTAIHFSGGTGTVYFGISNTTLVSLFASSTTPITFQVWFKLDATQISATTGFIGALSSSANSSYYGLRFIKSTGKFTWRYFDTTNTEIDLIYSTAPTTGVWHHLIFGLDVVNSQIFMYLDGANKQTASITNGPKAPGTTTTFIWYNELPVVGDPAAAMDEIGIWNVLLNQTQISRLYNSGSGLPLSSFT